MFIFGFLSTSIFKFNSFISENYKNKFFLR